MSLYYECVVVGSDDEDDRLYYDFDYVMVMQVERLKVMVEEKESQKGCLMLHFCVVWMIC